MKPGSSLFMAALLWLFLGSIAFFFEPFSLIWFLSGLILLPFIIGDGAFLWFLTDKLAVHREIKASLAAGEPAQVTLTITRRDKGFLAGKILLFDCYPLSMACSVFPAPLDSRLLKQGNSLGFAYTLTPQERGEWRFSGTELLLSSPLHFWRLKVAHPCINQGRTYPNFKKIRDAAGADLRGILEQIGVKDIRKRGQGMEFQGLREYQAGDSIRAIDWRATSRRGKVIMREYQEEQDQQVLFLLDAGYRLHRLEETGDQQRTQFDSALEAVLLLAYTALKHGDGVAAASFGNGERWLPPRKGLRSFTVLMNGLYDLKSAPVPSSPFSSLENALSRLNRRTFIILISNFREEDGESLSWIAPRIKRKHLLLMVSLQEREAEALSRRHPAAPEEAMETAAAFSYLAARRQLYKTWEHAGLLTLESSSARLSSALINRYLQVKRSGRL